MHYSMKRALAVMTLLTALSLPAYAADKDGKATSSSPTALSTEGSASYTLANQAMTENRFNDVIAISSKMRDASTVGSMDFSVSTLLLAQAYANTKNYDKAILYLEDVATVGTFDPDSMERYTLGLANLYVETKQIDKAIATVKRFIAAGRKPSVDMQFLYAMVLTEKGMSKEAFVESEKLMRHDIAPRKEFYQLAATCAQNVGNFEKASAYLDSMIKVDPNNEMLWNQLVAMQAAAGQPLAAIVTIETAQAKGFLKKEQMYITRIELYFLIERYQEAADAIQEGFDNHEISNELRFWEMLSTCYENLGEEEKVNEVLKRGAEETDFAELDLRLAIRLFKVNTPESLKAAIPYFKSANQKGNLEADRAKLSWVLLASTAVQLKDIALAEDAVAHIADYKDSDTVSNVAKLRKDIEQIKQAKEAKDKTQAN